jgi:phosphopantothenoylcysteine decarboxylase/phosphopantothenate--cysteine ligase
MSSFDQREILVGVTGGIAAYKTAALVSYLVQQSASVTVIMTESAQRFIGSATFAALTGRPVYDRVFASDKTPLGAHIELARQADLLCVAPASANFLGKTANGISDDLLSTLYLCFTGKIIMAPAMNCEMWDKPSVQRNVKQLGEDGVAFVEPGEGWLSCRQKGKGRMAEPDQIAAAIEKLL